MGLRPFSCFAPSPTSHLYPLVPLPQVASNRPPNMQRFLASHEDFPAALVRVYLRALGARGGCDVALLAARPVLMGVVETVTAYGHYLITKVPTHGPPLLPPPFPPRLAAV